MTSKKILVLGASGYIGSQLVPVLLDQGHRVRAAGRFLSRLTTAFFSNHSGVELIQTDVLNQESLRDACRGCDVVYYLIHSMNPQHNDFADADRRAAMNMIEVASQEGVQRIIYLGGLGEEEKN